MKQILTLILDIFRFHKKKIFFLLASVGFWFVVLFPYDDLSDFVTLKVTQMTQSNVYLQFDGLSFGLMPQLGIKMQDVLVETAFAPPLSVDTLGFAPKIALLMGQPAGVLKAYGLFGGDAVVNLGPSNELDTEAPEAGVEVELDNVTLKELSKFLKKSYNFPITMNGRTDFDSILYVDTGFKKQPKGSMNLKIQKLDIPTSNIPFKMQGATMSMAFPQLKLSLVDVVGKISDGKFFIQKGNIGNGAKGDDLFGTVTGDIFFEVVKGGRVKMGGYDLKINLNINDSLQRQLTTVLTFVDIYEGIGEKYKFDTVKGVRYSMRLTARAMGYPPRVSSN